MAISFAKLTVSSLNAKMGKNLFTQRSFHSFIPDGALKYRNSISQYHPGNGYTNPCLQTSVDQISTISRPRSTSDALNPSGGSPMHGRQLNGILSRGANGLHEDLDFPPTPRTLTRKKNVVWMRPHVSFAFARFTPRDRWNNDFHSEGDDALGRVGE